VTAPEAVLEDFLIDAGLAAPDEPTRWRALAGGVSSDIWRVQVGDRVICVKRALAKLRVAADWRAPTERNATEWDYFQVVGGLAPRSVPRLIAHDPTRGLFAMEWLDPDIHRLWKTELLAGRVDPADSWAVGDLIGRIHSRTAKDPTLPARFATDATFHALRLDAYILATARAHPDLADRLEAIVRQTAIQRFALVHGDVSPKNILLGPRGPVLLDAETAWWGDPAFDLAFCLNHLIIKARVVGGAKRALEDSFEHMIHAYRAHVDWESIDEFEVRAAALLPALALARVDGKSPVEYLDESQRAALRAAARWAVMARTATLDLAKRALLQPT